MRSASACATAVLPDAVGPKIAKTVSVTQPRPGTGELVLGEAGLAQVALDAPVSASELREDALDRLGRRLRQPLQALALLVGLRLGEPLLVTRPEPLLAQRVVGGDLVDVHPGDVQEKRRQESCAVLATRTVDDDAALRRVRYSADRRGDISVEVLEEDEVDVARGRRYVRRCADGRFEPGLDLLPVLRVGLEERDVLD